MKCKNIHKKLIFFINDELTGSINEEIKIHLKGCKKCNNIYTALETTLNLVGKKKTIKPNPFLYTRIKQKLNEIEIEKKQAVFNPVYKRVLQPVFLSLLLAAGIFTGIKLGSSYEIKQQKNKSVSQTTEFYFNDFNQEKLEIVLLKE
ncbi:MAG: zf-HC2 domain-containing protein [Bacteroidales bacterium]|nr:zf-HC2 domain-containing protein [Bacteroidales bacterium]